MSVSAAGGQHAAWQKLTAAHHRMGEHSCSCRARLARACECHAPQSTCSAAYCEPWQHAGRLCSPAGCALATPMRAAAHLDPAVVDEHIVHLEEGLLSRLVVVVAQEGVAQGVARLVVPDDVAGGHLAEAREDDLQVLRCSRALSPYMARSTMQPSEASSRLELMRGALTLTSRHMALHMCGSHLVAGACWSQHRRQAAAAHG